jgi:hypothetical protein
VEIVDINLFKKKRRGVDVRTYAFLSLPTEHLLQPLLPLIIYPDLSGLFRNRKSKLAWRIEENH